MHSWINSLRCIYYAQLNKVNSLRCIDNTQLNKVTSLHCIDYAQLNKVNSLRCIDYAQLYKMNLLGLYYIKQLNIIFTIILYQNISPKKKENQSRDWQHEEKIAGETQKDGQAAR